VGKEREREPAPIGAGHRFITKKKEGGGVEKKSGAFEGKKVATNRSCDPKSHGEIGGCLGAHRQGRKGKGTTEKAKPQLTSRFIYGISGGC